MTCVAPVPPGGRAPVALARRGSITGWVAVATSALGAGLLAARARGWTPPPCVLLETVGHPCPVCGTTRVAEALLHGRVGSAASADPVGVLLLLLVAVAAVGQALAVGGRAATALRHRGLPLFLGGLMLVRWVVLLRAGGPVL